MAEKKKSMYQQHPKLYRYTSNERYENPKEDFKTVANRLASLYQEDEKVELVDIGTANGELLYYLRKRFPGWHLQGFDQAAEFVATARSFNGLDGIVIEEGDLFELEGQYDVVIACCLLSLFQDFEAPLEKLIDLCRPGGHVLATGLFNPYDIDVRVEYCDNSRAETAGRWQTDANRFSQRRIRNYLDTRVTAVEFEPCEYDIELEYDDKNPIHVWTEASPGKSPWLVNGAWQIANQTLMIIKK